MDCLHARSLQDGTTPLGTSSEALLNVLGSVRIHPRKPWPSCVTQGSEQEECRRFFNGSGDRLYVM